MFLTQTHYPSLLSLSPALPSFTATPEPVSVLTGDKIMLECVAIGLPTPVVQWIRLNKTDSTNTTVSTNGSLVIINSSLTDTGDYVCIATNIVGINTVQVPITVMDPTGMYTVLLIFSHVYQHKSIICIVLFNMYIPIKFIYFLYCNAQSI